MLNDEGEWGKSWRVLFGGASTVVCREEICCEVIVVFATVPVVLLETVLIVVDVVEEVVHEENQDSGAEVGAAATALFSIRLDAGMLECHESSLIKLALEGSLPWAVVVGFGTLSVGCEVDRKGLKFMLMGGRISCIDCWLTASHSGLAICNSRWKGGQNYPNQVQLLHKTMLPPDALSSWFIGCWMRWSMRDRWSVNVNASRGWPFGCLVDLVWVLLSLSWLFRFWCWCGR